MRVLLVNDYGGTGGGTEIQVGLLRDGLRERGHDVRVLASSADAPHDAEYVCTGAAGRLRTPLQMANPSARRAIGRALEDFRPDVVHVRVFLTQLSPLLLAPLRGVPALLHAGWYREVCPKGTKLLPDRTVCELPAGIACLGEGCLPPHHWAAMMVQRRLHRAAHDAFDRVVANSENVARLLEQDGFGPATVVRNGVAPRDPRPPLAGPPVVAYAGRLTPEKGVDDLVEAVARCGVRARLVVAGEGPEREALEALARSRGVDAAFTGPLPRDDVERLLDQAWVQALPGRWAEPFGNAAAEALMRGTALVASRTLGVAEILTEGEHSRLTTPADVDGLAAALTSLLSDRDGAERLGAAGRDLALRELTLDRSLDRIEALYGELLRERPTLGGCR